MTTKPKASKFRIRRPGSTAPAGESAPGPDAAGDAPGAGESRALAHRETAAKKPAEAAPQPDGAAESEEIAAIRREGLTGRQLRMARRVAQRHGLAATSDFDAVRLLRARGIDPFTRDNMLQLVVAGNDEEPGPGLPAKRKDPGLPRTAPARTDLPSTELSPAEARAREITGLQRDIARRRRRKSLLLLTRLAFFVFLPTLIAGWYFYAVATPMYSTKAEFLVLKAESQGGIGSLLSGTQFATNQDAIAVQSYLLSKDAMMRLDRDVGFKSHFTGDDIDPIQRLANNASNEAAYRVYKRHIEIGYDPTEGVIKMEISAPDPQVSAEFAKALLKYAEERVDNLSRRKRDDQLVRAQQSVDEAMEARHVAQEKLVKLQQDGAVLDPEGRITTLRGQINNFEVQLQEKQLELAALQDNRRPNQAKVDGVQGEIDRLQDVLAKLHSQMTDASKGSDSLAELTSRIKLAQADVSSRDLMLQSAIENLELSRRDANAQARYLTTSVEPVASQDPSYPRKFENTLLAFLVFSGVYLMLSLTASILREQVSS